MRNAENRLALPRQHSTSPWQVPVPSSAPSWPRYLTFLELEYKNQYLQSKEERKKIHFKVLSRLPCIVLDVESVVRNVGLHKEIPIK